MDLKTSSTSEISDPYISTSKSTDLIKPKDGMDKHLPPIQQNIEGKRSF